MVNLIDGSLLDAKEKHICHQCNCVSNRAAGLALYLFMRFPHADIYSKRSKNHVPQPHEGMGNIIVCGDGKDQRLVINMMAQYYPGRPVLPEDPINGYYARELAFKSCLDKIAVVPDLESVAFPWGIGCGLGGGDWSHYEVMIEEFASRVNASVSVYRWEKK